MKKIYVSTVQRIPRPRELDHDYCHIYVIDWDTKSVLKQFFSIKSGADLISTIGSSHGTRGMTIFNNRLYIADMNKCIYWYDLDTLQLIGRKTIKELEGPHLIREHNELLHIVSTRTDAVIRIDKDHNIVEITNISTKSDILDEYVNNTYHDVKFIDMPWGKGRLHFNSIAWSGNEEYHIYNRLNMIFNFSKGEPVLWKKCLRRPHDLAFYGGRILTNSSEDKSTLCIDTKNDYISVIQKNHNDAPKNSPKNIWGMTRGLAVHKDKFFVGITPFTITMFGKKENNIVPLDTMTIKTSQATSIFDICLDPNDWK